ncbi:3'-5' exonuclease [Streptomyces sp. NPDC048717]|uniref:3'-5' exonuclease n=1 Tax=Streptomyces sp. NPDC048717 TaxID=3154928 RepID=UPI0034439049
MQPHQTDIQATASVPTPSRARTEGRSLGPEQAARYLRLHRRELSYLVEAGLLIPVGRSFAGTLRFAVSVLDAVAGQPLDWTVARSAEARRPSPWMELAGSASERACMVNDVTAALCAAGVDAWARYSAAADRWILDWAPAHGGGPGREEVRALLPPRLVRAVDAQRLVLLGPVGQTMHWAHDMLQPGVACVLDVETTGLSPTDRVIEVAAVDAHDGSVLIDTLVHPGPGIAIPAGATRVHGITETMVAGARSWSIVLPEVLAAVGSRVLLAYNSDFDRRMSVGHARALGADPGRLHLAQSWQCLMKRRSMWLGTTARLRLGGRHRALGDAAAARELLLSLRARPAHTRSRP